MTKHTPGPWTAINTNDGWQIAQRDKPGYFFSERRIGCRVDADEMAANAHLIAAAPELLEAAAYLLIWIEKAGEDGAFKNCVAPLGWQKRVEQARAAIAKAEGGES